MPSFPQLTRRFAAASAALFGFAAGACGPDGPDGPVALDSTTPGEVVDVLALDNIFRSENVVITAGTTVRWENRGRNDHDVLPVDSAEAWGASTEEFQPGDVYVRAFDEPGTFAYYCSIHGTTDIGMIGTIVVMEAR
ncbi:MAG: plastocyanin/azurin family copper-binding protein [Ilumatobacteraceae bacterium]